MVFVCPHNALVVQIFWIKFISVIIYCYIYKYKLSYLHYVQGRTGPKCCLENLRRVKPWSGRLHFVAIFGFNMKCFSPIIMENSEAHTMKSSKPTHVLSRLLEVRHSQSHAKICTQAMLSKLISGTSNTSIMHEVLTTVTSCNKKKLHVVTGGTGPVRW